MCKISVIVPVYNAAKFISDTLNSIQSQTINDIEILCIDDGSTDDSAKIIQERQVQDARIKYEYQSNQGAGAACNCKRSRRIRVFRQQAGHRGVPGR